MQDHNVLIIDDEDDIRDTIILLNKVKERKFIEAKDGSEGLSHIKSQSFDIIVCDITMPEKSGIQVIREARSNGIDTPFIFISGHIGEEISEKLQDVSNYCIVEKTEIKKISSIITDYMETKKLPSKI